MIEPKQLARSMAARLLDAYLRASPTKTPASAPSLLTYLRADGVKPPLTVQLSRCGDGIFTGHPPLPFPVPWSRGFPCGLGVQYCPNGRPAVFLTWGIVPTAWPGDQRGLTPAPIGRRRCGSGDAPWSPAVFRKGYHDREGNQAIDYRLGRCRAAEANR